jgi:hypothetical protein
LHGSAPALEQISLISTLTVLPQPELEQKETDATLTEIAKSIVNREAEAA